MSLGDLFPDSLRNEFTDRNIDIGKAILLHVPTLSVTYKKYVILIAPSLVDDNYGFVVINSRINENVNRNSYLKQQHVLIDCARHAFLEYDSYVDCSDIKQQDIGIIRDCIMRDPECVCGNVQEDIVKSVHETITLSRSIANKLKKKFGFI